jgi:hypothetical protein
MVQACIVSHSLQRSKNRIRLSPSLSFLPVLLITHPLSDLILTERRRAFQSSSRTIALLRSGAAVLSSGNRDIGHLGLFDLSVRGNRLLSFWGDLGCLFVGLLSICHDLLCRLLLGGLGRVERLRHGAGLCCGLHRAVDLGRGSRLCGGLGSLGDWLGLIWLVVGLRGRGGGRAHHALEEAF